MTDTARLHPKYTITRTDGSSAPGGKHDGCTYFVLDLSCDEHAIAALKAYAKSCRKENPALAADLDEVIANAPVRCGCREAYCPHTPMFGPDGHAQMAELIMDKTK